MTTISPLAPKGGFPDLPAVAGVELSAANAGVKYKDRPDVMLARLCPGTSVAGVFTTSSTRSAPVLDCQGKLGGPADEGAAILVNAGNANAFTGKRGDRSVERLTKAVAEVAGVPIARVFTASTGVIGEALPDDRIAAQLAGLAADLAPGNMHVAAQAIMTTDTFAKGATASVDTPEGPITISGFAKGSGIIAPDMATMLVYTFTDATIDQPDLQAMLADLTAQSFNRITVDSDTSTSDTLILAATNKGPKATDGFREALGGVMLDLAHQVVRDGEGASKFVEVRVTGATSDRDAEKVARSIADSPLVKTAVAGEDPNWGRVVMAVGKSGAEADRDRLSIRFGDILVAEEGWVSPDYSEEDAAAYMKGQDLLIHADLGLGAHSATVWTCDLTHAYITINADYRS